MHLYMHSYRDASIYAHVEVYIDIYIIYKGFSFFVIDTLNHCWLPWISNDTCQVSEFGPS